MERRREELSKSWGEHKGLRERGNVGSFVGKSEGKAEGKRGVVFRGKSTRCKVVGPSDHTVMRRLNPDQEDRLMDHSSLWSNGGNTELKLVETAWL